MTALSVPPVAHAPRGWTASPGWPTNWGRAGSQPGGPGAAGPRPSLAAGWTAPWHRSVPTRRVCWLRQGKTPATTSRQEELQDGIRIGIFSRRLALMGPGTAPVFWPPVALFVAGCGIQRWVVRIDSEARRAIGHVAETAQKPASSATICQIQGSVEPTAERRCAFANANRRRPTSAAAGRVPATREG
jgi:hypothetical protein